MPFRRFTRRSNRGVINSRKHILDSEGALTTNTPSTNPIAVTVVQDSDPFKPGDIVLGSKIFAFFITVFIIGSTGAPIAGSQSWLLGKLHSGQAGLPAPSNVGTSPIRNQVIHQEKGLVGSGDGTAMAFKGVIKVPKGMQTMREGDQWQIRVENTDTVNTNFCMRAIYKSFR